MLRRGRWVQLAALSQARAMARTCAHVDWRWLASAPSTIDAAKRLLRDRGNEDTRPLAVATAHQTAGRGTKGRAWHDDGQGNVALTVAFSSPIPLTPLTLLPLRIGTLVVEALGDANLTLKWPNDVLLDKKKVAGVLVESDGTALYMGIGVNVASAPTVPKTGPDRGRPAGNVAGDAVEIAQSIADALGAWTLQPDDAAAVVRDWSKHVDWNQTVELRETGERVTPVKLLPDGRLRVQGAGGERDLVADYLL